MPFKVRGSKFKNDLELKIKDLPAHRQVHSHQQLFTKFIR